jgi:hypothetical protein
MPAPREIKESKKIKKKIKKGGIGTGPAADVKKS